MKKTLAEWMSRCRSMDWMALYLRLFLGGIVFLHNIGKMQTYNEIVNSYPTFFHIDSAATFTIVTIAEVLLAFFLIIGFRVRFSALLLALGTLVSIFITYPEKGFLATELQFVYMGTYVALIISGAGMFSLDFAMFSTSAAPKGNK